MGEYRLEVEVFTSELKQLILELKTFINSNDNKK